MTDSGALFTLRAYQACQSGVYPVSGGWLDQPARTMRCFDIIGAEIAKLDEARARSAEPPDTDGKR